MFSTFFNKKTFYRRFLPIRATVVIYRRFFLKPLNTDLLTNARIARLCFYNVRLLTSTRIRRLHSRAYFGRIVTFNAYSRLVRFEKHFLPSTRLTETHKISTRTSSRVTENNRRANDIVGVISLDHRY